MGLIGTLSTKSNQIDVFLTVMTDHLYTLNDSPG